MARGGGSSFSDVVVQEEPDKGVVVSIADPRAMFIVDSNRLKTGFVASGKPIDLYIPELYSIEPVFHPQASDAAKLTSVAGHQGEVLSERVSGDEKVVGADWPAFAL